MADPLPADRVEIYPGCTVEVHDADAFRRNPLRQNPLIAIKDDPSHPELFFADAHDSTHDTQELTLLDVCVRCHPYAYGPLCPRHHAEVTA